MTEEPLFSPKIVQQNYQRKTVTDFTVHREIEKRLQERLAEVGKFNMVERLDLDMLQGYPQVIDGAVPILPESADAVMSHLLLPWVNDVRGFLLNVKKSLKPGGVFLASTLGSESFREFRDAFDGIGQAGNHILPYPDVRALGQVLMNLGFEKPVVDREFITLSYDDFSDLFADIKAHGATNLNPARQKSLMSKGQWMAMVQLYDDMFRDEEGAIPLTLEVIYIHALAPAPTRVRIDAVGS